MGFSRFTFGLGLALLFTLSTCAKYNLDDIPGPFAATLGGATAVFTPAQRLQDLMPNFPVGTMGVIRNGSGYRLFAGGWASSVAKPSVAAKGQQGSYRFGATTPDQIAPDNLSAANVPLPAYLDGSAQADPNGSDFDRDFATGGPTYPITSADGTQSALLQVYYGQYRLNAPTESPYYSALGLVVSTDGGETFQKLGEILQSSLDRTTELDAGLNTEVGGGSTLILADGNYIAGAQAGFDGASAYYYVLYLDGDSTLASPCNVTNCMAIARAPRAALLAAVFANETSVIPTLFKKYYVPAGQTVQPGVDYFTEPGVGGHFTPLLTRDVGGSINFFTAIYDSYINQYLLAHIYRISDTYTQIYVRSSLDLLIWSEPIATATIDDGGQNLITPTLVGDSGDPTVGSLSPWIYYVNFPSSWANATLFRRSLSLANE